MRMFLGGLIAENRSKCKNIRFAKSEADVFCLLL